MVTFDEFKKLDLITARVENVRDHPNADKLLILEVRISGHDSAAGSPVKKDIVAGIKNFYTKDELVGKNIVMINNLEPAFIRGVESSGMLLAVQDKNGISLVMPDRDVEPGSRIK